MPKRGMFITLEGIEGAGKTTLIPFLRDYLLSRHVDLVVTREPGGTEIADAIRQVILSHYTKDQMNPDAELLLYFASRAQHLARVIRPALEQGKTVLCDRFTDATYAYQGGGRGIDIARIAVLEDWVQQGLQPDLTILFDVDPEIGLQRIQNRGPLDRFEVEKIDFFKKVRAVYLDRAKHFAARYRVIDTNLPLETVKKNLITLVASEEQCIIAT